MDIPFSDELRLTSLPVNRQATFMESIHADILMHNKRRPTMKNVFTSCIQMDALSYYKLYPEFQLGAH